MSIKNIPDINSVIDIDQEESIDLLLDSLAFEAFGLAYIINAEAEKIQFVTGMLEKNDNYDYKNDHKEPPTLNELLEANQSVDKMLKKVIEKEIMIDFILENAIKKSVK